MLIQIGKGYCINLECQSRAINALLTEEMKKYIQHYTQNYYKPVNQMLRNQPVCKNFDEQVCQNLIANMTHTFRVIPMIKLTQDIFLFRGIKVDGSLPCKLDRSFTDLGFVSTSTDFEEALNFTDPNQKILMCIKLKKDHEYKFIPVRAISKHESENEVILPPRSKLNFVKNEKKESVNIYYYVLNFVAGTDEEFPEFCFSKKIELNTDVTKLFTTITDTLEEDIDLGLYDDENGTSPDIKNVDYFAKEIEKTAKVTNKDFIFTDDMKKELKRKLCSIKKKQEAKAI